MYVEDLIITRASEIKFEEFRKKIESFEMTDLGMLCSISVLKCTKNESQIALSQKPYASNILKNFQMVDCNPSKTQMETHLKLRKDGG